MDRAHLLDDYISELRSLDRLKNRGVTTLDRHTWDFSDEESDDPSINIDTVRGEVGRRIAILADENCPQEEVDKLNY